MRRAARAGRAAAWGLAAALVTAGAGCSGSDEERVGTSASSVTVGPEGRPSVYATVCGAATAAAAGDLDAAARGFEDAHGDLHQLATTVEVRDRQAAARLLEAKQRVEADLEAGEEALGQGLVALAARVGEALQVAGGPDPGPCP
ncbi:MAG TPA: hypothetical protein VFO65_07960 [Acidimicrobiales bacterium]|nr:hypothetical protein [Acidimicrobiales bacterium]